MIIICFVIIVNQNFILLIIANQVPIFTYNKLTNKIFSEIIILEINDIVVCNLEVLGLDITKLLIITTSTESKH